MVLMNRPGGTASCTFRKDSSDGHTDNLYRSGQPITARTSQIIFVFSAMCFIVVCCASCANHPAVSPDSLLYIPDLRIPAVYSPLHGSVFPPLSAAVYSE